MQALYLEIAQLGESLTARRFFAELPNYQHQRRTEMEMMDLESGITDKWFGAGMCTLMYLKVGLLEKDLGARRYVALILLS